jgi:5-methylthioadenosine/S-adenosylhomocysteine deaminase
MIHVRSGDGIGEAIYDTLITGGHLLTMTRDGVGFIADSAVAVDHGVIAAVGPREAIEGVDRPHERIIVSGKIVLPGLIDAHLHSAATTARGWAQEVSPWMASAFGPLTRHAVDDDAPIWTMLALMEGVANGTTCFGDYEFPMNRLVESHVAIGSRAVLCEGVSQLNWEHRDRWIAEGWRPGDPVPLDRETGEESLASELSLYERWHGHDDGRIQVIFGPHAADFISRGLLLRVQDEARKRHASLHLPLHRTNGKTGPPSSGMACELFRISIPSVCSLPI